MQTWYARKGFNADPFSLQPLEPNSNEMEVGFIDRAAEKDELKNAVQTKYGKFILFGATGEGKSSLLNYLEYMVKNLHGDIVRIDGLKIVDVESFLEELLRQSEVKVDSLSRSTKDKVRQRLEDLKVIELRTKEESKVKSGLEARLGAFVAAISGKLEAETAKGKEKTYYIAPRKTKLELICSEILPLIFEEKFTVIIADNLEKSEQVEFKQFLTRVSNLIPKNVLFVTTGNLSDTDTHTMSKCYDVFDMVVSMDPVDAVKLREFIEGRMKAYVVDSSKLPSFDDESIQLLWDRTRGNLRETFRYSRYALQGSKKQISKSVVYDAIKKVDSARIAVLSGSEKRILAFLAREDGKSLKDLTTLVREEEGTIAEETVRNRVNGLISAGFVLVSTVKVGRAYMSIYAIPKSISSFFE